MKTPQEQAEELAKQAAEKVSRDIDDRAGMDLCQFDDDIVDDMKSSWAECVSKSIPLAKLIAVAQAADIIIDQGRPHTGRNTHYPDGCECEQCENWDMLNRKLQALRATKQIEL